jgi:uncharacterized protein
MFQYDKNKSSANKEKHGIDFDTATQLWDDPDRVEISTKYVEEKRILLIAKLDGKLWSAIYTIRKGNIRIISVRKSRKNEKEIYYTY